MAAADWPKHDNKEWQKVLDRARSLGWPVPSWTSSHPNLVLKCPEGNPNCTIRAFKTGNGTGNVAQQSFRKVGRCTHRKIIDAISKIDESLDTADTLLTGAEVLLARGSAGARVAEHLEMVAEAVDDAATALEAAFDEAYAEHADLTARVNDLLEGDPDELDVDVVASEADPHLRSANLNLVDLPKRADEVVLRKKRLETLLQRRDVLTQCEA